jgi:hypothetical protein
MKFNILFCAFFLTVAASSVLAQTENVTVTYSKVQYNKTTKERTIFNLIKINPLLIFNGDIPIYFERRLGDKYSVEAGLGITHTDYIYEAFHIDDYYYYDEDFERNAKIGYSVSGSFKYYPSNYTKALDEFYFGPEIRHRRYNTEVTDCGTSSLTGYLPEFRVLTDFKFVVGYIFYISDNVVVDLYGGIGMRKRNSSRAFCDDSGSVRVIDYERINDISPTISTGFKFGFGF